MRDAANLRVIGLTHSRANPIAVAGSKKPYIRKVARDMGLVHSVARPTKFELRRKAVLRYLTSRQANSTAAAPTAAAITDVTSPLPSASSTAM